MYDTNVCPVCQHKSRIVEVGCFASHVQCYNEYGDVPCICYHDYHYAEPTSPSEKSDISNFAEKVSLSSNQLRSLLDALE